MLVVFLKRALLLTVEHPGQAGCRMLVALLKNALLPVAGTQRASYKLLKLQVACCFSILPFLGAGTHQASKLQVAC